MQQLTINYPQSLPNYLVLIGSRSNWTKCVVDGALFTELMPSITRDSVYN